MWHLTFIRMGADEELVFENQRDAEMVLGWFENSSASVGEKLAYRNK